MALSFVDCNVFIRAFFGTLLVGLVVPLTIIDFKKMVLPDYLNVLLAAAGIAQSLTLGSPHPIDAMVGAIVGAACLTLVMMLYHKLRGVQGIGLGDLKFVAAAGIWIGWQGLPLMLLIASTSALVVVAASATKARRFNRFAMIPFGPFLGFGALSAWLVLVTS